MSFTARLRKIRQDRPRMKKIRKAFWILALMLVMAAIFYFSSHGRAQSVLFSDEVAERLRIEGDETVQASAKPLILGLSLRNLAHVFLFFLLGFCAFQVMEKAIPAGIFGYAYAVLDEIHQQFSGRHARWQDTLIDLAGVVLGIALALTARYMIRKIRKGDPL